MLGIASEAEESGRFPFALLDKHSLSYQNIKQAIQHL